jgi:GTP-binding protein EngB required for normal cell division
MNLIKDCANPIVSLPLVQLTFNTLTMDISKSAIRSFQSPERLELLNDIDTFRKHGLDNLPQIVVCGDTSSGKSSVLGALSGIEFPVSGALCTRFATEIALRYSAAESITGHAFITPASGAFLSHRTRVESFQRDITNLDSIPTLMDEARKEMGLAEGSRISRDVLHLRLEGKQLPNLTLVDLPGLIHSSTDTADVAMVKGLIRDYFIQEQSIIMIVVSAENPIQNQGILASAQHFDPRGTRSIGVITKPDILEGPDKASLKPAILELAKNQHPAYKFTRGWHVVRCLNDKERTDGLDRDLVESALFGQRHWKNNLHHKQLGIKSLRLILCKYLQEHILQGLPELQTSLEKRVEVARSSLEILGDSRTTLKERMRYLTRISKRYGELVKDALDGDYSDAFFKDGDPGTRLRAKTMALTDDYEESMRTKGHSFDICQEKSQVLEKSFNSPEQITQSEALLKVGKLLETYRGPELSFLFNPRLVGELFKEQSQKWPLLTSEYIHDICRAVEDFLGKVVDFICPPTGDTSYLIFQHILEDALQLNVGSLESKARELFSPYANSFLFSTKRRLQSSLKRIEYEDLQRGEAGTITQRQQSSGPEIMGSDHDTRVRLLQYSGAYYDVAIETFIDNVVVLGVESCLLSKLEAIFTSETVVQMDEDTLNLVGGESEDMQSERETLKAQLATLDESLKRCRRHTSRHNWNQAKEDATLTQNLPVTKSSDKSRDLFSENMAGKSQMSLPSGGFGLPLATGSSAATSPRPFAFGGSTSSLFGGSASSGLEGNTTSALVAAPISKPSLFGQNAPAAVSPFFKSPFGSSAFGGAPSTPPRAEGEVGSSGKPKKSKARRERGTKEN